uniref:Uncharacterized protein n=1 Tax=Kalanchoe fedtschenkoi TaxID=63787 RepID=A0A7N0V1T9_KALFE
MTNTSSVIKGSSGDFTIREVKKEVVAAALPMQDRWLPQSNLDLILPPIDVGVFFCYHNTPSLTFASVVATLKRSLAEALVTFYPFAGEVVKNSCGEPEVLCNNRGVDFTQVYADVELRDLDLHNPDESVEGKLVPRKKEGVLSVQATELRCGGVVVACTFDHRVADAYSTNMFLVSWSEIARYERLSLRPSFRRSMIKARRPARYDPHMDKLYVPISSLPPPGEAQHELISRMYYLTADQLERLQADASSGGPRRTKLESFSAFLWQKVAESAWREDTTEEKRNDAAALTKMGIVVDGRTRIVSGEGLEAEAMRTYFGNVLSIPYGEERVDVVSEKPLSWVAGRVHDCLKSGVTQEHFMDLIDWVETQRPEATLAKIYCAGSSDGPAVVVSSGQRFPVGKMDFGWGRPRVGSYHFPWGGDAGYVMPMPNPAGNGDWIVYMHLRKKQIEWIQAEAAHVFQPLTSDYLDSLTY